jgi:type IV pilus assembly protein PilA
MRKMKQRAWRSKNHAGFTLVEVSLTVVIIGILAAVALVGFVRYRRRARMAEATNLVTAIKAEQQAYKSERGVFATVSNDVDSFYPAASPGAFKTEWGGPCSNCVDANGWEKLPVKPPEPVMYGYAAIAGVGDELKTWLGTGGPGPLKFGPPSAPAAPPPPSASADCSTIEPTEPFFVIKAKGDTDGDGVASTVLALSCSNDLIVTNEGE